MADKPRCHRPPTSEFIAEIVAPYQRGDRPAGQVAQDADLAETEVRTRAGRPGPGARTRTDGGLSCADLRELAELRQENRRLRDDVETLKRATAIFATAAR
jgi:transposase